MSSTTIQVSALVAITLFMIVSLCTVGGQSHANNGQVAAIASTQLNG
ncbi:MAG: hypothetical protein WDN06_17705 [Asticcacaulis sp.]